MKVHRSQDSQGSSMDRIAQMEELLRDCLRYLENNYDVMDGGDGHPRPNKAMALGNRIEWILKVVEHDRNPPVIKQE